MIAILSWGSDEAYSQPAMPRSESASAEQAAVPVPGREREVELLEEQIRIVSEYRRDQMVALWSAISLVSVVLVAFLSLIGFFTYRRLSDDRDSVLAAVDSKFDELKLAMKATLQERTAELKKGQASAAATAASGAIASVKSHLRNLEVEFLQLQYDVKLAEAEQLEEKKLYSSAITRYLELANIGLKLDWDWMTSKSLDRIRALMAEHGARFDPTEIPEVRQVLAKVPDRLDPLRLSIEEALRR